MAYTHKDVGDDYFADNRDECDHGNATSASLTECTMTPECAKRNKCAMGGVHVFIGYFIDSKECCSKCGVRRFTDEQYEAN